MLIQVFENNLAKLVEKRAELRNEIHESTSRTVTDRKVQELMVVVDGIAFHQTKLAVLKGE